MTHFVVHWSSYQGPSPHPDAQIIFSWFTNMTLMISLLWLNYSIHQRFSVAWRESPELFVFLHDLPPVFLSNQIISLFLLNISNSGLSWVTQPNLGSSHLFAYRHSSLPRIPSLTLSGTSSPSFCITSVQFSSVQFSPSVMSNSLWSHAACQASLSITSSQSLPKFMSVESVMPSHPLSSPSPPAFNLSLGDYC